jgi:hypothetical protein
MSRMVTRRGIGDVTAQRCTAGNRKIAAVEKNFWTDLLGVDSNERFHACFFLQLMVI